MKWLKFEREPKNFLIGAAIVLAMTDHEILLNVVPGLGIVGHEVEQEDVDRVRDEIREKVRVIAVKEGYVVEEGEGEESGDKTTEGL